MNDSVGIDGQIGKTTITVYIIRQKRILYRYSKNNQTYRINSQGSNPGSINSPNNYVLRAAPFIIQLLHSLNTLHIM